MTQLKTAALVSMVVLMGAFAVPARAEEDCNWYAQTSAKQEQENEAKNCGLKGEGWSANPKVHMSYCEATDPSAWRAEVEQRAQALQKCTG